MFRLILFLSLCASGTAANRDYVAQMIACEEKEETLVSDTYDAFLTLLAKRELPKGALRFPVRLVEKSSTGFIISRAFYVTPNELRGFEIFVPKDCVTEKEGIIESSTVLTVESQDVKQGIILLALMRKPTADR